MKKLYFMLFFWLTIPHIIIARLSHNKGVIKKDVDRWAECTQLHFCVGGGEKVQLDAEPDVAVTILS